MSVFMEEALDELALFWRNSDSIAIQIKVRWQEGTATTKNRAFATTEGQDEVFCDREVFSGGYLYRIGVEGDDLQDTAHLLEASPESVVGAKMIQRTTSTRSLTGGLYVYKAFLA